MLRFFKKYYPIRNIFFVVGEGVFISLSVLLASYIIPGRESFVPDHWLLLKILLITFVCQACLYYNDLYDLKITDSFNELGIRLLQALGFAAILLALVYFIFPKVIVATGTFIVSICFVVLLIVSWRLGYKLILDRGLFNQDILLMGSSDLVKDIKTEINERKDCGYTLALELSESDSYDERSAPKNPDQLVGERFEGLADEVKSLGIKKVIAGFKEKRNCFPTRELLKCRVAGIEVIEGNSFYEMLTGKLTVEQINPSWLIFSGGFEKTRMRKFLKRTTDLILSFGMLICLCPLILLVAILIKIDSRGPVIFSQERVGEKRKIYKVRKFRSMCADAEKICGPVWAQDNDKRVTRVGRIIRKVRIDEVPQLWNVFKGEMSFVGPRPEREFFVKELEKQIPYYDQRFSVKPGITGWAQINYGYGASVEDALEKLNYDMFYIKNLSFWMDLLIVLRTIKIVLFGKGAR
jgi:sugar transferase (PEP-CTERM system associated)